MEPRVFSFVTVEELLEYSAHPRATLMRQGEKNEKKHGLARAAIVQSGRGGDPMGKIGSEGDINKGRK